MFGGLKCVILKHYDIDLRETWKKQMRRREVEVQRHTSLSEAAHEEHHLHGFGASCQPRLWQAWFSCARPATSPGSEFTEPVVTRWLALRT